MIPKDAKRCSSRSVGYCAYSFDPPFETSDRIAMSRDDEIGFQFSQAPPGCDGRVRIAVPLLGHVRPLRLVGVGGEVDRPISNDQRPVRFTPEGQEAGAVAGLREHREPLNDVPFLQTPVDLAAFPPHRRD